MLLYVALRMTFKVGFKIKSRKKNVMKSKITLKFQLNEIVVHLAEVFSSICLAEKLENFWKALVMEFLL